MKCPTASAGQAQVFLRYLLPSVAAPQVAKVNTEAQTDVGRGWATGDLKTPRTRQSSLTRSAEVVAQLLCL